LAWLLIIGNVDSSENKNTIVRLMLVETFAVAPAIAIVVGAIVASMVRRSGWWLGGIAVMPWFIYGVVRGAPGMQMVLPVVYIALALAAAFLVSRFKQPLRA
jgi:hypothetical protein